MEKKVNINFEEKNYECKIGSTDDQTMNITISNEGLAKFNGSIKLKDIYEKIPALEDYTMKEIFAVFEDLKDEKFQIKKEEDKFKFSILIKILNKEKTLNVDISEVTQSEDDLIKYLMKTIKSQEERITKLENELKALKESNK